MTNKNSTGRVMILMFCILFGSGCFIKMNDQIDSNQSIVSSQDDIINSNARHDIGSDVHYDCNESYEQIVGLTNGRYVTVTLPSICNDHYFDQGDPPDRSYQVQDSDETTSTQVDPHESH